MISLGLPHSGPLGSSSPSSIPSCIVPYGNRIGGDGVSAAISEAYQSLRFNKSFADTFGAWYIAKTPTGKTITDETPGRKARTELATTGTAVDGTNYFEKTDIPNNVLGADDTSFTARIIFSGNGSTGDGDYVFASYDGTPDEGFRFATISGFLTFSIKDGTGATRSAVATVTTADIQSGGIYEAIGVYDAYADTIAIYVDAIFHDDNVAVSYKAPTQNIVRIGTRSDITTGTWFGNIFEAQIWNDQALTAAEIVKLRDKEISYFQGTKAPSVAWMLDGPTCVDLIADNDLTPVADPEHYSGSEGSTWLNDQGWNTTAYKSDFSEGFDNWTVASPSTREVVDFEGKFNVLKFIAGDDGDGTASSDRLQNSLSWDNLVNGESYTLKFDLYIPSTNGELDRVRLASSVLGNSTITPTPDVWETVELTGQPFVEANTYLRIYANNGSYTVDTGDVFYITNVEVIAEERIYPKRWNVDLDVNDNVANNAHSFGPVKRNREYRNGPSITLDGTMGAPTTYDASGRTTLSGFARILQTDNTGDQVIFDQSTATTGFGFRVENLDATTAELSFFHYPAEGGSADVETSGGSIVVTKNQKTDIGFSWTAATGDVTFFIDDGVTVETRNATTGILADATANMSIGLPNDATTNGFRGQLWDMRLFEGELTQDEFNWLRTQGESGAEPANLARHWPVIEEAGVKIQDIVVGDVATFVNDPTWDFTANDEFFHGETVGYSAVPIFDTASELDGPTLSFLGHKTAEFEFDFYRGDSSGPQCIAQFGSVSPLRIYLSSNQLQLTHRNAANAVISEAILTTTTNTLYRLRIAVVEGDSPATNSSITLYDRDTNEVLHSGTGLDLAMSGDNSAPVTLGTYNAGNRFESDLYRLKVTIGGVEEILWNSSNIYLNETTGTNDFSESGGTLAIKKIPAKTKSLDANGYPTNKPAGPWHNRTAAEVTETPVANSDSVNPTYYGLDFANTLDANVLADTAITGFPFSIKADLMFKDGGTEFFVFLTEDSVRYFGIKGNNSGGFSLLRRNNGSAIEDVVTGDEVAQNVFHTVEAIFTSATTATVTINGVTTEMTGLTSVAAIATTTDGLILGQYRTALGVTVNSRIRNVIVKQGDTVVNDLPLYKDPLGREAGDNPKHGTLSATGVSFKSNAMETDLNPDIAEHENRAVKDGDSEIISIGDR